MKKIKLTCTYLIAIFCIAYTLIFPQIDKPVIKTTTQNNEQKVMIYMLDEELQLVPITLHDDLSESNDEKILQMIQLMKQKFTVYDFVPLIPQSIQCEGVNIIDNIVQINFNEAFLAMNTKYEMRVIEGIVSSVIQLNHQYKVEFLVNGEIKQEMPLSHFPLNQFDYHLGVNNFDSNNVDLHLSESKEVVQLIEKDDFEYYVITTKRIHKDTSDLDFINEVLLDISYRYECLDLQIEDDIAYLSLNRNFLLNDNLISKSVIQPILFTMVRNNMAKNFVLKVEEEIVNFHGSNESVISYPQLDLNTIED